MTSFPVCHKTIFVLDHSKYFSRSCGEPIEYDVPRSKGSGVIPMAPIYKSLWTCNVESLQEYLRIVFDIYPVDKQIQVICGTNIMNDWNCPEPVNTVMMKLALLGPPKGSEEGEFSLSHGLTTALKSLREATSQQQAALDQGEAIRNRGRIVCITALTDDTQIAKIQDYVQDTIHQVNKTCGKDNKLAIDRCELVLVHSVPVDKPLALAPRGPVELSASLACEVATTPSGRQVYNKLVALCCRHFDLTSTTVTGIPMKEEQNASSSANYDVELLHPAAAHDDIFKTEHAEGLVIPSKEGLPIETAPLKWCTPKSSVVELHHCSTAFRICPVDVNSRPSSCLTNFLLSGRAVMLEQPRKSGVKVLSHMLAAHGGQIFIHSIPTSRSILEDPPSISEGCGGRVTDYRIPSFGEFMKENRLAPSTPAILERNGDVKSYVKAMNHLERSSRFWPLIISDTILFNISDEGIANLAQLVQKQVLTDEDVVECKKAILKITAMESKNDPLPVPASGARGKGPKREEQYRHLWTEVEALVRGFSDTSPQHLQVLECVANCKKPGPDSDGGSGGRGGKLAGGVKKEDAKVKSEPDTDRGWQDAGASGDRDKHESEFAPSPKKIKSEDLLMRSGGQTLLSMWNNRLKTIHNKRTQEFDGRLNSDGPQAKLYIHLEENNGAAAGEDQKASGTK